MATALPYEYFAFFRNLGNVGKGVFQYLSLDSGLGEITRLYGGWGMRIFDYDNDGAKDVFFANSHVMDNIARTQPHLAYEQKPLLVKFDGRRLTNVSGASGEAFTRASASRGAATSSRNAVRWGRDGRRPLTVTLFYFVSQPSSFRSICVVTRLSSA